MTLGSVVYSTFSSALTLKYKVGRYLWSYIPSHINYIVRIDPRIGMVVDEYCIRHKVLDKNAFYLIGTWHRHTAQHNVYILSGSLIDRTLANRWHDISTKELVDELYKQFSQDRSHGVQNGILAILINDVDVSKTFHDMRGSLSLCNNVTAAAIALVHKYLTELPTLPYYVDFKTIALNLLEDEMKASSGDGKPEVTNEVKDSDWTGKDAVVTIIDYELNETKHTGHEFLFE